MRTIGQSLEVDEPQRTLAVLPARAGIVPGEFDRYGTYTATLLLLLSGLVFLIACANLVNLMLARNLGRASELAIRTAVGASSNRILQLVLVETILLAGFDRHNRSFPVSVESFARSRRPPTFTVRCSNNPRC